MIDNKDFYPTPPEVIPVLKAGINFVGKYAADFSAGSGNLLRYLKDEGAHVSACEIDPRLAEIAKANCDTFFGYDCLELTAEKISHMDYIIINPPFSADEKHVNFLYDIMPEGCELRSLINHETYDHPYTRSRSQMVQLVRDFGNYEFLGDVFKESEDRQTNVRVGMVTLIKPKTGDNEFDGFFDLTEEYGNYEQGGLIRHNDLLEIVNRYVGAVKMFNEVDQMADKINGLAGVFGSYDLIKFGAYKKVGQTMVRVTRDEYKKELQKLAWKTVFEKMKMERYVTSGVLEKLNKFVEKQANVPFKLSNVFKMIDMIIQTVDENMNDSIIKIFEDLTNRSYQNENRLYPEGWKTNGHYLITQKFIMSYVVSVGSKAKPDLAYNGQYKMLDDLAKALCYLTSKNWGEIGSLWYRFHCPSAFTHVNSIVETEIDQLSDPTYEAIDDIINKHASFENPLYNESRFEEIRTPLLYGKYNPIEYFNTWYDWGFFEMKFFKKGTAHIRFKNLDDWAILNQRIAKIKGVSLPSKFAENVRPNNRPDLKRKRKPKKD